MNQTRSLILLALLAVAATALLLWSRGEALLPDQPDAGFTIAQEESLPADPIAAESVHAGEPDPAGDEQAAPPLRLEVAGEQILRALVVQVWDGKQGVPAVAADVFVLDGYAGPELSDPFAQHWSVLAERNGLRFETNQHGRAELPPVRESAILAAKRPGAYGFARVGREHRDLETITLQPDETLTIRVVDGTGRGVSGVPVGVVQQLPERLDAEKLVATLREFEGRMVKAKAWIEQNPQQAELAKPRLEGIQREMERAKAQLRDVKAQTQLRGALPAANQPLVKTRAELRAQRRTGEDGLAVFRHFQIHRHGREGWWPADHVEQFEAVLMMPLQRPESVTFSGRPLPSETIVLRMPPAGSIALRTVDRDGRPFTHPVHAELRLQDAETAPWARVLVRKPQGEAALVFPFVGLGLRFLAHCRLDDEDFRWQTLPFAGPGSPGEQITVDLVITPGEGMLTGRLLDGAGAPLAGARPTFLINSPAGRLEGEEITLDPAGRFHLPYQVREQHRPPFRLEIRRNDLRPTAGLAMTLAMLPADRVTDLGDLRLDPFRQIALGTVVDDRGEPIPGATVQLQREREVGGKQPRLQFADEAFSSCRADSAGRYELFGELEPGRYRLRAEAKEHFPCESAMYARGERVELKLPRRSRIVGTVSMPDWMPSRSVRVRMESAADPQQRREDQIHDYRGRKLIYFDWVQPGLYNVLLTLQGFPDPFLRVDRLEILPGQMDPHPRLVDLDLGAFVFRFEIHAVDEQGQKLQPQRPLLARITHPDGRSGFVGFPWNDGRVELFSPSWQLDVVPLAPGFFAEPAVLGQGRSELRFLRIPPVDLQVPGMRQSAGPIPIWMSMELLGRAGLPDELEKWDGQSGKISAWYAKSRFAGALLGAGDAVRLTLMCGGRYRVVAHLGAAKGARPVAVDLGQVDVRLAPGAGPQRVTVELDPARVRQALAELAQRGAGNGTGR